MNPSNVPGFLPSVAPAVVAAAVEGLTSRLRKKLDAAVEQYASLAVEVGEEVRVVCGADAVVTLSPGGSGVVVEEEQARCSCLLAPRCLHRAAVLSLCPVEAEADYAEGTGGGAAAGGGADHAGRAGGGAAAGGGADRAGRAGGGAVVSGGADRAGGVGGAAAVSVDGGGSAVSVDGGPQGVSAGMGGRVVDVAGRVGAGGTASADGAVGVRRPGQAQVEAAEGLWGAGAAVLVAGVPAAGAVAQAELLRAAHTARLAGLPRAEAAALRVVQGLRSAREKRSGDRLADLVSALRELLLVAGRLAVADPDPALVGSVRRTYEQGGSLRVHGVFREPVISATGYGGVVTHVITEDGRWFSVTDVRPGGSARARGAGTATVAIGSGTLNHAQLARAGLLITGATISPDGRLGAGRGVRATPTNGMPWTEGAMAALFARPLGEVARARLSGESWSEPDLADEVREPVGCDLMIFGAAGGHVLARELAPGREPLAQGADMAAHEHLADDASASVDGRADDDVPGSAQRGQADETSASLRGRQVDGAAGQGRWVDGVPALTGPLIRLVPAGRHPDLAHVANLQRLASRPGLCVRVVGRVESDRAATLTPLAVGPVPGVEATLRLPPEWGGRADLGYDRLQSSHLPPQGSGPGLVEEVDPVAGAPLWRVRRLVELAVAGGRRAVAEAGRGNDFTAQRVSLRRNGFPAAAGLAAALAAEADRRERDVFGRSTDSGPDGYARAWLAAAVHLAATERALVRASWQEVRV